MESTDDYDLCSLMLGCGFCENGVMVSARTGLDDRLVGRLLIGVPVNDDLLDVLVEEVLLNARIRSRKLLPLELRSSEDVR